jgi:hypothetical protein
MFSTENISYHFVGKYTATNTTNFRLQASFSCNGTPLIFLDGQSGAAGVSILQLTNTSGTNWTATVAGRNPSTGALTSLDIYVFAFPNTPPSTGYGIWAKNASGTTTLNLQQKLLKLSGAFVTTASSSNSSNIPSNATLLFGSIPSNYIVCAPVLGQQIVPAGASSLLAGLSPRSASSTTVSFLSSYVYVPNFAPPSTNSYFLMGSQYIMFADKTLYV